LAAGVWRRQSGRVVDADQAVETHARLDQAVGADIHIKQLSRDIARVLHDFVLAVKIADGSRIDLGEFLLQAALRSPSMPSMTSTRRMRSSSTWRARSIDSWVGRCVLLDRRVSFIGGLLPPITA
jgi:hypothetical protein